MNSWAQGIIVAIIIGSIIQMILPDSKNKKYIKVIIGIYVLFCIISPVIGKSFNLSEYNIEKYLDFPDSTSKNEIYTYDENVKNTFKNNLIYNIQSQLKAKGYTAKNIDVEIDDECNILKIKIANIYENEKEEERKNDEIYINKVETNINSVEIDMKDKPTSGMAISDKNSLIEYISENYHVDKNNIIIE